MNEVLRVFPHRIEVQSPTPELPVEDVERAQRHCRDVLGFSIGWLDPSREIGAVSHGEEAIFVTARELVKRSGRKASALGQKEAAAQAPILILAVPGPTTDPQCNTRQPTLREAQTTCVSGRDRSNAEAIRPDLGVLMRVGLAILIAVLAACSKRETQTITPWLRVDVLRPRADDMIRVGTRAEVFEIQRGGRWKKLGTGTYSRYMVLGEGDAVLVDLNDRNGLQLLRPNEPPRPIPASFGRMGTVTLPFPSAIDLAVRENPHRADVYRFDLSGNQLAHFEISVPDAYTDCRIAEGVGAYGMDRVPYTTADCTSGSSQAKCLMLGPRDFVYAVPPEGDWSDCGNFGKAGISVMEPAQFTLFR